MEERIKELGLHREYAAQLVAGFVARGEWQQKDGLDQLYFLIAHASAEEKCRAAVECVKEKA
jgi:hypothetical protein